MRRWCGMGRPFVVYKEGNGEIGGGDPITAWLHCGAYSVSDHLCQCNLVGVDVSGRPRAINGQGWHHLGMLYASSDAVWSKFPRMFRCDCRCAGVKIHYPNLDCNKHTMGAHIATKLVWSVVHMFADVLRDTYQLGLIKLSRVDVSQKAHLSKEEIFEKIESIDRREHAPCQVYRFLKKCEACRSEQCPPPKRVLWENRPRWNGGIINLT